jgi:hypothetical protein
VKTSLKVGTALGAIALTLAFTANPASADPDSIRPLVGVGSDTSQDVLNGLATVVTGGTGSLVMGSYDARPPGTIQTRLEANPDPDPAAENDCIFPRPNGSGQGRQALRGSEGELGGVFQGADVRGCVSFARSSSYALTTPQETGNYTYVPFGVDAVTYAINEASDLPTNLSLAQLTAIYRCQVTTVGGFPVTPLLIQSGSGTRQFFLQQLGILESEIPALLRSNGGCLEDLGNTVQEHDGRPLEGHTEYLVPFSVGQFLAQQNAAAIEDETGVVVEDRRGPALLGQVNGVDPTTPYPVASNSVVNTNFPMARDIYNVVPTADLGDSLIDEVFTGADSEVCDNQALIQLFGFGFRSTAVDPLHNSCGATDLRADS